jgi:serine/threonine-protein kinase HipA
MNYCPITLEEIAADALYSQKGLHWLSPVLKELKPLNLSAADLRQEAMRLAAKISIQGVQPKLSAKLVPSKNQFEIVDAGGTYILKPPSELWTELPANESLTMTLAKTIDLETPLHGLVYNKDKDLVYFIKRFDRFNKNQKYAVEDFAQLSMLTRETKYRSSMEKVAKIITTYCSFPMKEKIKLFTLTLFSYVVGNEDMHLKNFSIIQRDEIITMSPVYDLLNTSIALESVSEELALPLHGKKHKLTRNDLSEYFGKEILGLTSKLINSIVEKFISSQTTWERLITHSKLSAQMQQKYQALLDERLNVLKT